MHNLLYVNRLLATHSVSRATERLLSMVMAYIRNAYVHKRTNERQIVHISIRITIIISIKHSTQTERKKLTEMAEERERYKEGECVRTHIEDKEEEQHVLIIVNAM